MSIVKVYQSADLDTIRFQIRQDWLLSGYEIDRMEWQAKRDDRPQTKVYEFTNVVLALPVPDHVGAWQGATKPNLPWAEDHFLERVSGSPLNPGKQYRNWPWYEQGVEEHKQPGQFSHTYMERFWPRFAGNNPNLPTENRGIRYPYGDLNDLISILSNRPHTRQAYLPIWFPEDLYASGYGERVPCTLGYHFQAVGKSLDCTYFMRSCDWYRYMQDDVYMAGRLLQHVAFSTEMRPRHLTVHIANLHIFSSELARLVKDHETEQNERINRGFQ